MGNDDNMTSVPWLILRGNSWMKRAVLPGLVLWFGSLLFVVISQAVHADNLPQPRLPTVQLEINGKILTVEVAATEQQRYMGLSFRPSLAKDEGMLFVYPREQALTFTMRNTLIPLSIAFISEDLVINEIHHMDVGPGQLFPSKQKAQFALEVDQGWFAANGIKAGDRIIRRPVP